MSAENFFITTPIYYVNDVPHIGHAYTSIVTDVIARFARLDGKNVKYLTGTDEHGQKVEESAKRAEISVEAFVDKNSEVFRRMSKALNISNNHFIRTTEESHKIAVQSLWSYLVEEGHIYLGEYAGWYSMRDEAYYDERELTEDGLAPTGSPVKWVKEPSYFFALSKWQDKLLEHYEQNPDFIWPKSRRNEIMNFVKSGLNDLSVSRTSFKWGVTVPSDDDHVVYVWLDALTNYISYLGYPDRQKLSEFWPASAQIVGKDILRFHAVYWPAFLMAANLELPKSIVSHGWWTNEGQKISKSIGNVIDPFELIDEFGLDPVRYFLMREINFGSDGNFSRANLVLRNNAELSNKIGNLLQRTAAFIYKNCNATIPGLTNAQLDEIYKILLFDHVRNIIDDNKKQMQQFNISKVMDNIIELVEHGNSYIDQEAPWVLRKTDPERMNKVLYVLLEISRYIAIMLQPFIPCSAEKMLNQLNVQNDQRQFINMNRKYALKPFSKIPEPKPIFRRLD